MRGGFEGVTRHAWPPLPCQDDTGLCTYTFLVIYVLSGTGGCQVSTLFPFWRRDMRHGVKKSKSVGQFKRRVGVTDKVNMVRNRRGGIRL